MKEEGVHKNNNDIVNQLKFKDLDLILINKILVTSLNKSDKFRKINIFYWKINKLKAELVKKYSILYITE